jgi:nitroimidazol reductase NimA-like FMN-containing flavoprotein (pyridoxamine 5'-phosphate oxidase superfamily)
MLGLTHRGQERPGECLRLLETVPISRMVFTECALPVVHPVNFLRDGSSVVIRNGVGTKLDAARRGDIVAFEADHIDPDAHEGAFIQSYAVDKKLTVALLSETCCGVSQNERSRP